MSKSTETPLRGRLEAVWKLSHLLVHSFPHPEWLSAAMANPALYFWPTQLMQPTLHLGLSVWQSCLCIRQAQPISSKEEAWEAFAEAATSLHQERAASFVCKAAVSSFCILSLKGAFLILGFREGKRGLSLGRACWICYPQRSQSGCTDPLSAAVSTHTATREKVHVVGLRQGINSFWCLKHMPQISEQKPH